MKKILSIGLITTALLTFTIGCSNEKEATNIEESTELKKEVQDLKLENSQLKAENVKLKKKIELLQKSK